MTLHFPSQVAGIALICILLACQSGPKKIDPVDALPDVEVPQTTANLGSIDDFTKGIVEDFSHASRYSYIRVKEGDKLYWIAGPFIDVTKGETIYFDRGMQMLDFKSSVNDQVFDTLLMVNHVLKDPQLSTGSYSAAEPAVTEKDQLEKEIERISGSIELVELFASPDKYAGTAIIVQGRCVKVNRNIMGKNWIHLQDGTQDAEGKPLDLTITTQEDVTLGSMITIKGTIAVDQDLGYGYKYDVLMEEAELINNL